jgi:exodeoxyribonuclease-3
VKRVRLEILSWNVNGLRSALRKEAFAFLERRRTDALCLQEIRTTAEQAGQIFPRLRHQYWNPGLRSGYAGTATFSSRKPLSAKRGMGSRGSDAEGRVLTLEFERFHLVNVYTPNSRRDLSRLPLRQRWDRAFLRFLRQLAHTKPVIFCGDLNAAHEEIDLARPRENRGTHGFTDEERAGLSAIVRAGFVDSFRELTPEGGHYTWWSVGGARERNVGWRIDYVVLSASLAPALRDAFMLPEVMGSDHCPVGVVLEL